MRLLMLASLLPAAMAEFDQCARASGTWVGFDQGLGSSRAQAVTHSGNNVFVGGHAAGNLSFGSRHADGKYHDHMGITQVHDTLSEVTIHHETRTMAATSGSRNTNVLTTQLGQDSIIYKLTDAGMPDSVYPMDTMPADGNLDGNGTNGRWGGWSYITGLDGFDLAGETDQVAAVGMVRGTIKFPKVGGTPVELKNLKDGSYDPWVAKIDMTAGGSVVWATKEGIDLPTQGQSAYPVSVATTAAGHVIATTRTYINRTTAGVISKFNGIDGALVWSKKLGAWGKTTYMYQRHGKLAVSDDEIVYMTGRFKGKDSAAFAPLTATSCEDGAEDSVVVAAFDASPSDAPVASWVTVIGCGNREGGTFVEGDYIYVSGELESNSTLTPAAGIATATCTLTGALGGFLVKLSKADGKCVWAKDMAATTRVVATTEAVWTATSTDDPFSFDAKHEVKPAKSDFIVGKFRASDGVGLWGDLVGAEGSDRFYDMAMTPQGPVAVGYSSSAAIGLGAVAANNLQQTDADNGQSAMFVIQMSMTDTLPSCITACPSGELSGATIDPNNCFIEGKCLAHDAPSPRLPCFACDANTNQRALPDLPDLTNHCYLKHKDETLCHARGDSAPAYARYGSESVCETCDPDRDPNAWSLTSGFFHDRDIASQRSAGANNYGLYFVSRASGCQILPDMPQPSTPSAGLTAANANPTLSTVAGIGARTTSAISAVNGAAKGNQGAETAWGWYHGDSAKCTKSGDVCNHTPSAVSDALAVDFETSLYYGHSVARVKVQQALSILQSDLATPSEVRNIIDLKMDIVAHMLIPHYQGAIKAAYQMDAGTPSTAKANGAEHWKVINEAIVGDHFDASDRAQLAEMFALDISGKMNFCTVQALLLRNLPGGSNLQYGSNDCIKEGCTNISTYKDEEDQHVTGKDVGILKVSLQDDGSEKDCSVPGALAWPPPSPPPSPASTKVEEESSDSGLTGGEVAGIAIGGVVGGTVLLVLVGLLLRSLLFKDAKPVFTCLEKSTTEKSTTEKQAPV